jgi:fructuronate reductase
MEDATRDALARETGVRDAAAVQHEPFRQWVIEDRFAPGARPAWEAGGAQIVADVAPFEAMKLRCLNGTHSALAYLGSLAGMDTIAEAATDPVFARFLHRMWQTEIIPTLRPPEGTDLTAYCNSLLTRCRNPAIRHRLLQIAADGSQKLPQRLLAPMRDLLGMGRPAPCLAMAVAGWMHHLGTDAVNDPLADRLRAAAGDPDAILAIGAVFDPALAADPRFRAAVIDACETIAAHGARAAVAALAQAE